MKKKISGSFKAGSLFTLMGIAIVLSIMFYSFANPISISNPYVEEKKGEYVRLPFLPLGDATPGNTSGVLRAVCVAIGELNWNQSFNATDADMPHPHVYEYGDTNESILGSNAPSGSNLGFAVKARYSTDYYIGGEWRVDYANATFQMLDTDMSPTISLKDMEKHIIALGDDYMWLWFVENNSDSGFSLSAGGTVEATNIRTIISGYSYS